MNGEPDVSIAVPIDVVTSLATISDVVGAPVVLVGGWAVRCRLQMARSDARPTDDLDLLFGSHLRPAGSALEAIGVVQSDPSHPCRLTGLPLVVDLLADDVPDGVAVGPGRRDQVVEDPDGLRLLIPPFAELLVRSAEAIRLVVKDGDETSGVLLPRAGALFAAKVANIALEFRAPDKRASDGEDVVRLIEAFGSLALLADLETATAEERADLGQQLGQLGAGGIAGQARAANHPHERDRLDIAVRRLTVGLEAQPGRVLETDRRP